MQGGSSRGSWRTGGHLGAVSCDANANVDALTAHVHHQHSWKQNHNKSCFFLLLRKRNTVLQVRGRG